MMGEMGLWMLLSLLIVAAVIGAAIYLAIRAGIGRGRDGARHDDPQQVLRDRFAKGEITADEFGAAGEALKKSNRRDDSHHR